VRRSPARWVALTAVLTACLMTACERNGSLGPTDSATTPVASPLVAGTVTYRTREALPADARVEVSLQDVSSPDPGPVSSTSIATMGRQQPFPWTIAYDPAALDAGGSYGVTARIFVGGKVAYRTAAPVPVITNGAPTSGVQLVVEPV
jgi:putative lipoprotein